MNVTAFGDRLWRMLFRYLAFLLRNKLLAGILELDVKVDLDNPAAVCSGQQWDDKAER
ncbi:MAG TPA: hypothetical protein VLH40_05945 [Atribacteraceae bacterium]|nr:hypothetical protein [Atribacteraceae bacterium]